jgi:hypothetical protein
MGYSDMNKKPFEPLSLLSDGYDSVNDYIENDTELLKIGERTKRFLLGFYSDFGLELLSSVNYIMSENNTTDRNTILARLSGWNNRKRSLFSNEKYVDIAINHIKENISK